MITLNELRKMLAIEGYNDWRNFDRRVLKPAIEEINEYSDRINIKYDTYRKGRMIDALNFIISPAKPLQVLNARQGKRKRL